MSKKGKLDLAKLNKEFQQYHEAGAKEFGGLWLDANAWSVSAAQGIDGVVYHEQPFKTLISRIILCTLRRAIPKVEEPRQQGAKHG